MPLKWLLLSHLRTLCARKALLKGIFRTLLLKKEVDLNLLSACSTSHRKLANCHTIL